MRFFNTEGPVVSARRVHGSQRCRDGHLVVFDRRGDRDWREKVYRRRKCTANAKSSPGDVGALPGARSEVGDTVRMWLSTMI